MSGRQKRSELSHLQYKKWFLPFALLFLAITSVQFGYATAASKPINSVHLTNGQPVDDKGTKVYLDGLNYKDQFKYLLYEKKGAPDWSGIGNDFRNMAGLGAKAIRVWFNWIYYEPTLGQLDSKRMLSDMQRIVDIARQYGLYVIITIYNYHVWINGKLVDNWLQAHTTSSRTDPDNVSFWLNDGDFPAKQRNAFLNLWNLISSKFKKEPVVVSYDLVNEPFNKYYEQPPQWAQTSYPLKALYDQVISALRQSGDGHIVMLDYNWVYSSDIVPLAAPSSDSQVLYDIHMYYTALDGAQGWDTTSKDVGPWGGKTQTGTSITYTYPDPTSGHDATAISGRFTELLTAESRGYVFYIGEFGQTTNSNYNFDLVRLAKQFGFTGLCYFEYSPDEPMGSVQTIQPILTYVQQFA